MRPFAHVRVARARRAGCCRRAPDDARRVHRLGGHRAWPHRRAARQCVHGRCDGRSRADVRGGRPTGVGRVPRGERDRPGCARLRRRCRPRRVVYADGPRLEHGAPAQHDHAGPGVRRPAGGCDRRRGLDRDAARHRAGTRRHELRCRAPRRATPPRRRVRCGGRAVLQVRLCRSHGALHAGHGRPGERPLARQHGVRVSGGAGGRDLQRYRALAADPRRSGRRP